MTLVKLDFRFLVYLAFYQYLYMVMMLFARKIVPCCFPMFRVLSAYLPLTYTLNNDGRIEQLLYELIGLICV